MNIIAGLRKAIIGILWPEGLELMLAALHAAKPESLEHAKAVLKEIRHFAAVAGKKVGEV